MKLIRIGKLPGEDELKSYLKERIIPPKFCYPGLGADQWHRLIVDDQYTLGDREIKTVLNSLPRVRQIIGQHPINLIHIGPGDGRELFSLFYYFKPKNGGRYAGVDISKEMIQNTIDLNEECFSKVRALWYLTDVETPGYLDSVCKDVRGKGAGRNMILLSNQGVLFSQPQTLENIMSSMTSQDYFFITMEGDDSKKRHDICKTYDLKNVRDLLSIGIRRAGYNPKRGKFETSFNEKKSAVEVHFTPEDEDRILCLTSYKPQECEFRERLKEYGFKIKFLEFYKDIHTVATLLRK